MCTYKQVYHLYRYVYTDSLNVIIFFRYGLGIIHYRQEKHLIAEEHFRRAVAINPSSPVLLCYHGMVQHAQKKSENALQQLNKVWKDGEQR